jgi:hypothetical protein
MSGTSPNRPRLPFTVTIVWAGAGFRFLGGRFGRGIEVIMQASARPLQEQSERRHNAILIPSTELLSVLVFSISAS